MELKTISALLKTSKSFTNLLAEDVVKYGFNLTEFSILEALFHKGELSVGELLDKVLVNNSTVSYTLSKLTKTGLILRKKCMKDGRVFYITLSDKGREVISEIAPQHYAYIESIGKNLTSEEEKTLRELLKKLNKKSEIKA